MIHGHPPDHHHDHGSILLDPAVLKTERGMDAVKLSFIGLIITATLQLAIVLISNSVALLADTIHNFADASTSIPLWIAFHFSRKKPNEKYTYGYGRLEDFAGLLIIGAILVTAIVTTYLGLQRLIDPRQPRFLWTVIAASLAGFLGNELVAQYRIRVGKEIGSAALIADGNHARVDGLTSLAVIVAVLGTWFGYPISDSLVALVIVILILRILMQSARPVIARMLDAIDPHMVEEIRETLRNLSKIQEVTQVRMRWIGHWLHAEINVSVASDLTVKQAHEIAMEARHNLLHSTSYLSDCIIHVDPVSSSGEEHHKLKAHSHGGTLHSH
jgi:cation diffusion facilitator family transporter